MGNKRTKTPQPPPSVGPLDGAHEIAPKEEPRPRSASENLRRTTSDRKQKKPKSATVPPLEIERIIPIHKNHLTFTVSEGSSIFSMLPQEIVHLIAKYCSLVDLVNLSAVNKELFTLTSSDTLWLPMFNITPWQTQESWIDPNFQFPEHIPVNAWREMNKNKTACCWKSQYLQKASRTVEKEYRATQIIQYYRAQLNTLEAQKQSEDDGAQAEFLRAQKKCEEMGRSIAAGFILLIMLFLLIFFRQLLTLDSFLYQIYSLPSTAIDEVAHFYASNPATNNLRYLMTITLPLTSYKDPKTALVIGAVVLWSHWILLIGAAMLKLLTVLFRFFVVGLGIATGLFKLPPFVNKKIQNEWSSLMSPEYLIITHQKEYNRKLTEISGKYYPELNRLGLIIRDLEKKHGKQEDSSSGSKQLFCTIS